MWIAVSFSEMANKKAICTVCKKSVTRKVTTQMAMMIGKVKTTIMPLIVSAKMMIIIIMTVIAMPGVKAAMFAPIQTQQKCD